MSFFKKIKYSARETCNFYGNYKKTLFSILFIQITGSLIHWIATHRQQDVLEEFMIFAYYVLAPIGLLTIIVFLWNLLRSDLRLEIDRISNKKSIIKNNNSSENDYLEEIGILWEFLKEYDYKKQYKERNQMIDFLVPHTRNSTAYINLLKCKRKLFYNQDLQSLLEKFLKNFKCWNSSKNILFSIIEIKPIFETKKDFTKKIKDIKSIIDEIAAHIN